MNNAKSLAIVARDKEVLAPCSHLSYYPLTIAKHNGAIITDEDGNEYIDFLASASSMNLGGSHPVITEAIRKQLENYSQYANVYTYNEKTVAYAERLVSAYPGGVKAKICFGNSGSDANDCAVKFARGYTGRTEIIVFKNGYHGNTYGSSSMTTCSDKMHEKMGPFLPGIHVFPFYGIDTDDATVERDCIAAIEAAFAAKQPAADTVAAVVIEAVQGDGGILPAHPVFMKKLYDLCKQNGILFIVDEVQQGFWRTGKFFAVEHYEGIIPDGICMGKSIGAGLTLGAFMARAEIMDCLPAPAHLFSLAGNAAASAAGCAAFDYYKTDEFQSALAERISVLEECAAELMAKHPDTVQFARNLGMSMGIGLGRMENGKVVPDADVTFKVLYRAYEKGMIVISVGENVLRCQPPLVITPEQLRKAFSILDESIQDLKAGRISDDVFQYRAGW